MTLQTAAADKAGNVARFTLAQARAEAGRLNAASRDADKIWAPAVYDPSVD